LAADVGAGRFREDLFHRLAVGILRLPPLRERDGDIDLLTDAFLAQINAHARGRPETQEKKISANAKKLLGQHPWPGNIRELYHTLLRAAIWSPGPVIQAEDITGALVQVQPADKGPFNRSLTQGFDLQGLLDEVSRSYITKALKQSGERKNAASKMLGFANHQTLGNWMKRLGLETQEQQD
jgi:DNA-binding NtrC family response regulator